MALMSRRDQWLVAALLVVWLAPLFGAGPAFIPDASFKGSSLTGWNTLGQADWRAENGDIIGTPKQATGGWLLLDQSFQDVGFYASFRCTGGCKTGVLLRAERTPQGVKGVYLSLTDPEVASYSVTLDPMVPPYCIGTRRFAIPMPLEERSSCRS
jgi:3-keto-disaccharide hydrolase